MFFLKARECNVTKSFIFNSQNRNTIKVFVGATPSGLVSYVSSSFAESSSDSQVVERSDLVSSCNQRDSIMTGKGFYVKDLCAPMDVHINIPTFFTRKNRLSGQSVIRERKNSSKHVSSNVKILLSAMLKNLVQGQWSV